MTTKTIKSAILSVLATAFFITSVAQPTIPIYFHANGYKGNLYTRLSNAAGQIVSTQWFYCKDSKEAESATLYREHDGTYQLYNGAVSFSFTVVNNKIIFNGPFDAASCKDTLSTVSTVVLSFNTASVKIKMKSIGIPYAMSAFALIPGRTTTDGSVYNALYHDTTVTLIKGMSYQIGNQTFLYLASDLFNVQMPCNRRFVSCINPPGVFTPTDLIPSDFTFTLNDDGTVTSNYLNAARSRKNILIFKTASVEIDPACISRNASIHVRHDHFTDTQFTSKTKLRLIAGMNNILWYDSAKGRQNLYYTNIIDFKCSLHPYKLSDAAKSLIRSYNALINADGVKYCDAGKHIPTVSSSMPSKDFSNTGYTEPLVTFSSFINDPFYPNVFRTIWDPNPAAYDSDYHVCPPDPIIFSETKLAANDGYQCTFIPKTVYKAFTGDKNNWGQLMLLKAIAPGEINCIESVYIEQGKGYIANSEPADYANPYSSKGVVVLLKLRNGQLLECYVLNNYDAPNYNTLIWKYQNNCN